MNIKKQRGFTLAELAIAVGAVAWLCFVGWVLYAIVHFVAKFW